MRLLAINPVTQQRIAIVVPIIALLLSLFVVYPKWGHYRELQAQVEKQHKELNDLRATPLPVIGAQAPTAPDRASEPPEFLGQITRLAQETGCRLVNFDITSPAAQEAGKPIRALRARVELGGQYAQIRDFLFQLGRTPRLYVVTDFSLTGNNANAPGAQVLMPRSLRASIEIERYVAAPTP